MIYVYNPKGWKDPILLAQALRELGSEAKATRKDFLLPRANLVINWGFRNPLDVGLNNAIVGNKLEELEKLKAAGVNTVNFSRERPNYADTTIGFWLARRNTHRAGNDLAENLLIGDFYVQKISNVRHEFRVHVFKDKSIRAGIKKAKEGAHPWIRSLKQGWALDYGALCQQNINNKVRNAAKAAIAALGYDFGAVDVALLSDGKALVFEVNSAPGLLTKNTATAYAKHFKSLLDGTATTTESNAV